MILKIKNGYSKNETQNWRLIDNIKELSYDYILWKEFEEWKRQPGDVNAWRVFAQHKDKKYLTAIYVTYKNDCGTIFLTDSKCYIMSDEGKTVETVYAWS